MLYLLLIHKKKIDTTTTPMVFIGSALSARERDYGTMYLLPFEECSPPVNYEFIFFESSWNISYIN